MKCIADIGDSQVGDNSYRMIIYGNGTIAEAKAGAKYIGADQQEHFCFENKMFQGKRIAQGSAYVNTKTLDVVLYDEENDKWGDE